MQRPTSALRFLNAHPQSGAEQERSACQGQVLQDLSILPGQYHTNPYLQPQTVFRTLPRWRGLTKNAKMKV